jgi:hypothetical protein
MQSVRKKGRGLLSSFQLSNWQKERELMRRGVRRSVGSHGVTKRNGDHKTFSGTIW